MQEFSRALLPDWAPQRWTLGRVGLLVLVPQYRPATSQCGPRREQCTSGGRKFVQGVAGRTLGDRPSPPCIGAGTAPTPPTFHLLGATGAGAIAPLPPNAHCFVPALFFVVCDVLFGVDIYGSGFIGTH